MSQGGNKGDNTLHDSAIGWGILLAVLAVLAWLFWYFMAEEIRNIIRWIRYGEMWFVSFFVGDEFTVAFNGEQVNFQQGFEDTPNFSKEDLRRVHLAYFNSLALQPLKYVFIACFACAAAWAMFKGPNTQYRRKLGLEGLIERHAGIFPVVSPVVKFNPSTQPSRPPGAPVPVELPAFAEALGPEEWLAYHSIPVPDGKVDEEACLAAFRKQLGKRWKGVRALPPYKQILLAAFCLKAARKREQSDEMLGRVAQCWSFKSGLNLGKDSKLLKEARSVLSDKGLSGGTLKEANQHAFEVTALLRALQYAREEGGVLAPATFVWLRGHDRVLWYPMNNLGRHSLHMEAMGAMSHFKAERRTSRPIPIPKLEDAIFSIREYMNSSDARPIPALDYSGSKKRSVKKAK